MSQIALRARSLDDAFWENSGALVSREHFHCGARVAGDQRAGAIRERPKMAKLGPAATGPYVITSGHMYDLVIDQRFPDGALWIRERPARGRRDAGHAHGWSDAQVGAAAHVGEWRMSR